MKKYSFVDICDDIFGFIPDCSNFDNEGFSCMNVDSEKIRFKKFKRPIYMTSFIYDVIR